MPITIRSREKWKKLNILEKDNKLYHHIYDDLLISNYGKIKKIVNGHEKYCKITFDPTKGYNVVSLMVYNGSSKKQMIFLVHRLVALNFIKRPNNMNVVNHINGNKKDNYYKNLEWTNTQGNMIHASVNGMCHPIYGESHYISKLNDENVRYICNLINQGLSNVQITNIMNNKSINISRQAINQIRIKKSWKHISKDILK